MFFQRCDQTDHDRAPRRVADVQYPASRVGRLLSPNRRAVVVMIENYSGRALKHFVEQFWTFVSENARGCR